MNNTMEYKGYVGSVEFSEEDALFYGKILGIRALISYVYTYAQLFQTASKRLFNLKNKLTERYQEMNAKDYIAEILNEPKQTEMELP